MAQLKQLRVRRGVNDRLAKRVIGEVFKDQLSDKQVAKIKQGASVSVDMSVLDAEDRRAVAKVATPIGH